MGNSASTSVTKHSIARTGSHARASGEFQCDNGDNECSRPNATPSPSMHNPSVSSRDSGGSPPNSNQGSCQDDPGITDKARASFQQELQSSLLSVIFSQEISLQKHKTELHAVKDVTTRLSFEHQQVSDELRTAKALIAVLNERLEYAQGVSMACHKSNVKLRMQVKAAAEVETQQAAVIYSLRAELAACQARELTLPTQLGLLPQQSILTNMQPDMQQVPQQASSPPAEASSSCTEHNSLQPAHESWIIGQQQPARHKAFLHGCRTALQLQGCPASVTAGGVRNTAEAVPNLLGVAVTAGDARAESLKGRELSCTSCPMLSSRTSGGSSTCGSSVSSARNDTTESPDNSTDGSNHGSPAPVAAFSSSKASCSTSGGNRCKLVVMVPSPELD